MYNCVQLFRELIMYKEFDFEELRERLARIMKEEPRSQSEWSRMLDMNWTVFANFINKKRPRLHPKNATKLENFIELKEKELGIE
jgi:hypothetical protein